MSRSTNASEGTPDDGEGRLGDDRDDHDELTDEASDRVEALDADDAEDADDVDELAPDDDVTDAEDESDEDESDAAGQTAAASKPSRSVANKRSAAAAGTGGSKPAAKRPTQGPVVKKDERRGPIAAIVLFVRQVIAELRKVVTPTTKELGTYSAVVIVFVLIVMAYVGVLDFAVGRLVLWAFGG